MRESELLYQTYRISNQSLMVLHPLFSLSAYREPKKGTIDEATADLT
jgi:hypothetical protein